MTRAVMAAVCAENLSDPRVEAGISGANIVERAIPRMLWLGLKLRG